MAKNRIEPVLNKMPSANITVRDRDDSPFGALANDAVVPLLVETDTRLYPSVVNYVYANLLPETTFREEVRTAEPRLAFETFQKCLGHLKHSWIQSAVYRAVTEKVKQDRQFFTKLMDTKDFKIVYRSNNALLGSNPENAAGDNIYGQVLQQVRNEIRRDRRDAPDRTFSAKDNEVYLAYVAEVNLKKALRKHDLEKYIVKDSSRSIKQLVKMLETDYGKTEVYSGIPDMQTVLVLHEKRNVVTYTDPNSLIRAIRKSNVRSVLKKNTDDFKMEALLQFTTYIISKNNTLSVDKTRYIDEIVNILKSKREAFADRVTDLYGAKALPGEVMYKIKQFKSQLYFPSAEQIAFFESENVRVPVQAANTVGRKSGARSYATADSDRKDTVFVVENDLLSPSSQRDLTMAGYKFTSIAHYTAFEMAKMYYGNWTELYTRIKNLKLYDMDAFVEDLEKIHWSTKPLLLEKAIVSKLQIEYIKNLMFSVESLTIHDRYGLETASKLYEKHKDRSVVKIPKILSFERFVVTDFFMYEIVKLKVNFYFNILDNLMVHAMTKRCRSVSYDDLVSWMPFKFSPDHDSDQTAPLFPAYLVEKIHAYRMEEKSQYAIWKVVMNNLKQSEKIVGVNTYDVRYKSLFVWSAYLVGQSIISSDKSEDSVLTALMSILTGLKELNISMGCYTMTKDDVETAVRLCLGQVRSETVRVCEEPPLLEYGDEEEQAGAAAELSQSNPEEDEPVVDYAEETEEEEEPEFEGFDAAGRKKFNALLKVHFNPLKNDSIDLQLLEKAVMKVSRSKVNKTIKTRRVNFFKRDFQL